MGYFLVSAPELDTPRAPHCPPRAPHCPPFEGSVVGFNIADKLAKSCGIPMTPTVDTQLLDLRTRWLDAFLVQVLALNPEIPRDVAVTWVDNYMPKTADELAMSMTFGECEKLAFRLADAWDAA